MKYFVNDIYNERFVYDISYKELREEYHRIMNLDEKTFFNQLPKILHSSCIISFFKEIPSHVLLCDEGLIHELAHCLDGTNEKNINTFKKLKNLLKILELA